ncbi:PKHD-type hydroxylase [Phenylobacterium sp. Root77]|jgi:PKHD-type hydroxylase|uniref:Fe2+-dependent dioxygenase n=1 Tax=unclassified Phenylobacterium TaxID=2640670 RepID=UPI0006F1E317|nr:MULTISPECIES: Fe2+-dependent dioxygenase [unclassified Phenylobacterium]KQW73512.1 PKHD-type hydroxylase [Phenylobacterium sp. Root1277]KQW92731.1 PKHD-type hydroxylase [Phenylobacterium sp. Root1290]KRC40959.1 PKHD-type hydroxylase [Phenylobacterium sp. Root77]
MMLHIPEVLTKAQVAELRQAIDAAPWVDGNATSGTQSALAKRNAQLPEGSQAAQFAGEKILDALSRSPLFVTAALPQTVFPPLFNRYGGGQTFATHVDNSIRQSRDGAVRIRSDLSATLFLTEPEDYDGGELLVEDTYGVHEVKLPAGDLILYPASSLHQVTPVTRGARTSSFFWIQSMIRDDARRALLFQMDIAIQQLSLKVGAGAPELVSLTGTYHNLLRMWAEV